MANKNVGENSPTKCITNREQKATINNTKLEHKNGTRPVVSSMDLLNTLVLIY